jgi:hypothetical protein
MRQIEHTQLAAGQPLHVLATQSQLVVSAGLVVHTLARVVAAECSKGTLTPQ